MMMRSFIGFLLLVFCSACNTGTPKTIELPRGKKLVSASMSHNAAWMLVRPMRADERPEQFELIEADPAWPAEPMRFVFIERK